MLLSVTLMMGCAWKGHLNKGDDFMAAANYDAAATEYAEALRLRPDDQEIAAKLADAKAGQIEARSQRARAALDANNDGEAISLAAEVYAILPNHPKTVALIDQVVEVTGGRAKAAAAAGQFAAAMATYDGIISRLPSVQDRVSADASAVAQAWIAQLTTASSEAETAGRLSSALLYRAKIVELSGAGQAERDAIRDQVVAQLRYLVRIKTRANDDGANAVAAALLGKQGASLLEIVREGEGAAATLSVKLGRPKFATDKQRREESAQYQSGTKQVPNPFYESAQSDVLDEERRLVDRENEVTKQQQYVEQYTADVAREGDTPGVSTGMEQNLSRAQSRLEAARRSLQDQRNVLLRAKEKAASTPQTKEEPVYATHTFTITTHELSATVAVKAELKHADGQPSLALDQPLSVAAVDDAHGAQNVAGISEDPLTLPSKDELAGQLYAQAAPAVGRLIVTSFANHRAALLAKASAASDPGEKLELLLRYVIVDAQNVDAQVVADILAISGVPGASLLLRR